MTGLFKTKSKMALELQKEKTQKADGTEIYIEVEDATGLYNASTNPGGFGAPNPARNTLALIFYGNHKNVDEDIEAVVEAYDPETVTTFTMLMERSKNGHLEYYVFAVPVFDPIGSYANGDITYNKEDSSDKYLQKRVAGVWVRKEAADLVGEEAEIVTLLENELPVPQVQEFINELNADQLQQLGQYIKDAGDKGNHQELFDRYTYANGLLRAATDDFAAEAYNEAQIKVEELWAYEDLLAGD